MEQKQVIIIRGDGIGPEIAEGVTYILDKAGAGIAWEELTLGETLVKRGLPPIDEQALERLRSVGVALKSPLTTPIGEGFRSVNVELRKTLDLYANFRPVKSLPGVKSRYENVDLVFIRENTEGLYAGLEHEVVPGVVTSLKVSTRNASVRIAEYAFSFARKSGRKKITAVHKANIMKLSDGLALKCYREVATRYPDIVYDEKIIDAMAMALVLDPSKFDILLMENLYGDILSDLGAGLVGGLGVCPSGNIGAKGAIFEAVHGSAPDIAGKGIANPMALLLSAIEMLRYLEKDTIAQRIESALLETLKDGRVATADLGGKASTVDFSEEIARRL